MQESRAIPCAIYRGGTSRGVFFRENDFPYLEPIRTQVLLNMFGSPNTIQVDGIGGNTSTTSKAIIVGPSRRSGTHVEMRFGQVGIDKPIVDWGGTCGNLTAAVGPFAVDQGLIAAQEPVTVVTIYSINTGRSVSARVPVRDGRALSEGDFKIAGVRGSGARIDLEFIEPAGTVNGRLLPTGRPSELIKLDDGREFRVSIVDAGNVVVFCDAIELGLKGTELPDELTSRSEILGTLEAIRSVAAERIGIVANRADATCKSPGLPKIGLLAAAVSYATMSGERLDADRIDIVGRLLSMQTAHRSYMGGGAICTAAAAVVEGTIAHELCSARVKSTRILRIGHPQGVMDAEVKWSGSTDGVQIQSATISRTARRIMDGSLYVPERLFVTKDE
jgi:2-methylaconitate cis-trans-isomerase PrpF